MDEIRRKMRKEWVDNTRLYTTPIGMTGRRPVDSEFQATVEDVRKKFNVQDPSVKAILDVGCNNGLLLKSLESPAPLQVGLDFCMSPMCTGREMHDDIQFVQGEITALPFPSGRFHRVLCYNMFHYLSSPAVGLDAIRELYRVLTPGGEMLVGDLFTAEHRHLIPEADQIRWNSPDRPFMHRMENWMFMPVTDIEDYLVSREAKVWIIPQTGDIRCPGYRFDIRVQKTPGRS